MQQEAPKGVRANAFWREFWKSAHEDGKDVWFHLDEGKFHYLLPLLPPRGKTLEVGCGSARISRLLCSAGFEVTGLDCEVDALRCARREFGRSGLQGAFALGDANHLPFGSGRFDVVLSTGLLEHFEDPFPIVTEMVRVLQPGGLFYSDIVPSKFSLLRSLDFLRRRRGYLFELALTKGDIHSLLERTELIDVKVFAAGVFPPRVPLAERWRVTRRFQDGVAGLCSRFSRRLDGTSVAELLGVYYFASGRKPYSRAVPQKAAR